MATFQAAAADTSSLAWAQRNSTTWNKGTSKGAMQGLYTTGTASLSLSRVGLMVFSGLGNAVKGKAIQSIGLAFKFDSAGYDSNSKVLGLYKARWQYINESISGAQQIGDALGSLTGHFYNDIVGFDFSASQNTTLFNNMKSYFAEGNSALVCYSGESAKGGNNNYSYNYLRITRAEIYVTYEDTSTVKYYDGSSWKDCNAYYYDGSNWKLCNPYYHNGSSWVQV